MSKKVDVEDHYNISLEELIREIEEDDRWDDETFGSDIRYARRVPDEVARRIDEKAGFKPISIRLPIELIDTLKLIARHRGVGYQPLVRDNLVRFAEHEMKMILKELRKATEHSKLDDTQSSEKPKDGIKAA